MYQTLSLVIIKKVAIRHSYMACGRVMRDRNNKSKTRTTKPVVVVKCSFKGTAVTASKFKYELNNEDQSLYANRRKAALPKHTKSNGLI